METALVLPLTVFLFFGTLQLILMMQGRILAQYAVSRATRSGSLNHGSCGAMQDVALAALLPSLEPFAKGADKAKSFVRTFTRTGPDGASWRDNRYNYTNPAGGLRGVVWIDRVAPLAGDIDEYTEEYFDVARGPNDQVWRLETRMVYWYPLRIPFANWVISEIAMVQLGIDTYRGIDPLSPTMRQANWLVKSPRDQLSAAVKSELRDRIINNQFAFPIYVTSTMRMMTPPRRSQFKQQNCPRP